jgi:hypothetical protein
VCGHAVHVSCIDVWLQSSATCPLCRAALWGFAVASAIEPDIKEQKHQRGGAGGLRREQRRATRQAWPVQQPRGPVDAEASTSARPCRCFSMGSYQHVLSNKQLLVFVHVKNGANPAASMCASCDTTLGKKIQWNFTEISSFSVRSEIFYFTKILSLTMINQSKLLCLCM